MGLVRKFYNLKLFYKFPIKDSSGICQVLLVNNFLKLLFFINLNLFFRINYYLFFSIKNISSTLINFFLRYKNFNNKHLGFIRFYYFSNPIFKQRRKFCNRTFKVNFWLRLRHTHFIIHKFPDSLNFLRLRFYKRNLVFRCLFKTDSLFYFKYYHSLRDIRPYKHQGYYFRSLYKIRLKFKRVGKVWIR